MGSEYVSKQHLEDLLAIKDGEIKALKSQIMDRDIDILKLKLEINLLHNNQTAKKYRR